MDGWGAGCVGGVARMRAGGRSRGWSSPCAAGMRSRVVGMGGSWASVTRGMRSVYSAGVTRRVGAGEARRVGASVA